MKEEKLLDYSDRVKKRFGASELYFEVPDVIKDIDRLKKLYELFAEVLKELESIGVASGNMV